MFSKKKYNYFEIEGPNGKHIINLKNVDYVELDNNYLHFWFRSASLKFTYEKYREAFEVYEKVKKALDE